MSDLNLRIGQNIRKIRKAKNITLIDMASEIKKGKSTVSKYETGEISIDVETLYKIADFLKVSFSSLMSLEKQNDTVPFEYASFTKKYIYLYDGRVKKIITAVLEEYSSTSSKDEEIMMYFDVKNEKDYKFCGTFYKGSVSRREFVDNYSLENQKNSAERVWLCCLNDLRNASIKLCVLSGLSYKTMLPVSIKALLCDKPVPKDEKLKEMLLLSREDIKLTKKNNMFTLCERL